MAHVDAKMLSGDEKAGGETKKKLVKVTLRFQGKVICRGSFYESVSVAAFEHESQKEEKCKDEELSEQYGKKKRKLEGAPKKLQSLLPQLRLATDKSAIDKTSAIMQKERQQNIPCQVRISKKLQQMKARKRRPQAIKLSATRAVY